MITLELFKFVFFALAGGAAFAILFRVPQRYFFHAVGLAMVARFGLSYFVDESQVGMVTFLVAFIIGLGSHILARITGAPSQAFLIPGVISLVPGSYIYRAFSSALLDRTAETIEFAFKVVSISAGISFALLLANWLMPPRKTL